MDVVDRMHHGADAGEWAMDASLVLRTVLEGRRYLVAVTHGRVVDGQVELGLPGVECLRQVVEHCREEDPEARLHFAELTAGPRLAREMAQVFDRVGDGGAIVFLCRSQATSTAALGLLNVRLSPMGSTLVH